MCLLLMGARCGDGFPLVVAANRDERYDRPASTVARRSHGPAVLAGRDEEAGGTWLAVNEHGVVAGLTNQPALNGHDPTKRSRGELPLALTRHARARSAVEAFVAAVDATRFNPCSLLVGDRDSLFSLELGDAPTVAVRELGTGWHVLENRPFGVATAKTEWTRRRLDRLEQGLDEEQLCAALAGVLADHTVPDAPREVVVDGRPGALTAACVHAEHYGTRSSTIVVVPEAPATRPRVLAADGPPCTSAFWDATDLWR